MTILPLRNFGLYMAKLVAKLKSKLFINNIKIKQD